MTRIADLRRRGPIAARTGATLVFALLVLVPLVQIMAAGKQPAAGAPIQIYARTIEIDERAGIAWYRGDVSITDGTFTLKADTVEVRMREGEIELYKAFGRPVEVERRTPGSNDVLRAKSLRAVYHAANQKLDMYEEVRVFQQGSELRCAQLHYDLQAQRFVAEGGERGERCYVLFQPKDKGARAASQ